MKKYKILPQSLFLMQILHLYIATTQEAVFPEPCCKSLWKQNTGGQFHASLLEGKT